jgi:6-phosphogluconolactonase (cycloisomerase 2 family)
LAQTTSASASGEAARATSYVYVNEENASQTGAETQGFAVAGDGSLTSLPGSPYDAAANFYVGVSGSYFFLSNPINASIETYAIGRDGALSLVTTTPAGSYPAGTSSEGPFYLSFDTTGRSVYPMWTENDAYQAFNIERNGSLSYVNYADAENESSSWLSFAANDKYAYQSACYHGTPTIEGYTRSANGGLSLTWNPAQPPQPSGTTYEECPWGAAAWGNRYVVIAEQQNDEYASWGPVQMFVYAINGKDGSLSTTNTVAGAPALDGSVNDFAFDASGNWLAVGGSSGIAVFSFSNGVLRQTGSYSIGVGVSQLAWDRAGHLIAYGSQYGQPGILYVFNVRNGMPAPAPGSPQNNLPYGGYLAVKPL